MDDLDSIAQSTAATLATQGITGMVVLARSDDAAYGLALPPGCGLERGPGGELRMTADTPDAHALVASMRDLAGEIALLFETVEHGR